MKTHPVANTIRSSWLFALSLTLGTAPTLLGQEAEVVELPDFVLTESRVANEEPASSYAAPVSSLRFEPRVDLQSRGFGEAQGDITVRGGIFEGTSMQVGGMTIFDPMTGHYTAELPVPPMMLGVPQISTGVDHAFAGLNATTATIDYAWRPVATGGQVTAVAGTDALLRGSADFGQILRAAEAGRPQIGFDGGVAYSRSDGTVKDGDHEFWRVAGRLELRGEASATQFFAGYQDKFFGWPNMYTPFGVSETEHVRTTLLVASHTLRRGEAVIDASVHYRVNRDDYEFDRYRPGIYNPFEHETRVTGGVLRVRTPVGGDWHLDMRAEGAADAIDSTNLTHGTFMSRSYWRLAGLASRRWVSEGQGEWELRLGAAYDDTNRDSGAVSPMAEVAWEQADAAAGTLTRVYAQASESTRVPAYITLNASSTGGLFRGNPNLGREKARNYEIGVQRRAGDWSVHAALFHRRDDPMVDWTYSFSSSAARSANAVKVETTGVELVAARSWEAVRVVAGYTWLAKRSDYFGADVDASFYALNFPKHRFTLAIVAELGGGFELRSDNEFRVQEPNALRGSGDRAVLSSLGLHWIPESRPEFDVALVVDNLWNSGFEEIPAVLAPGRQVSGGVTWRF